jgi:hypothetical protein
MMKLTVLVTISEDEHIRNKMNVEVGFPSNQAKVSVNDAAYILASGISLLVKTCNNAGMKDHNLLSGVIQYLENEFASVTSFSDGKLNTSNFAENDTTKITKF